jgi:hypothetical protein
VWSPAGGRHEAQDYYRHAVVDNADWAAVDSILAMEDITPKSYSPEEFQHIRNHQANGIGGLEIPTRQHARWRGWRRSGLAGIAVSFVNYLDELL